MHTYVVKSKQLCAELDGANHFKAAQEEGERDIFLCANGLIEELFARTPCSSPQRKATKQG